MKRITLLLAVFSLQLSVNATVFTVCNTPGFAAQYTEINPAIAAANPSDTIYVKGSAVLYADATITKSITLIGAGTYSDREMHYSSFCHNLFFSSNISNVKVEGFNLWAVRGNSITNTHYVDITNNSFPYTGTFSVPIEFPNLINCSNWFFHNNTFGQNFGTPTLSSGGGCFNFTIENNLFHLTNGAGSITLSGFNFPGGVIQHNTFIYPPASLAVFSAISNTVIQNNIFYNCDASNGVSTSSFNNNITYSTSGPLPILGGTNIDNTDPQFVNVNAGGQFNINNNYTVQTTGPAHNAGSDGTDLGYYGGLAIIDLSPRGEVVNMPVIRQMTIQNFTVPVNGNINVKVRSTLPRVN